MLAETIGLVAVFLAVRFATYAIADRLLYRPIETMFLIQQLIMVATILGLVLVRMVVLHKDPEAMSVVSLIAVLLLVGWTALEYLLSLFLKLALHDSPELSLLDRREKVLLYGSQITLTILGALTLAWVMQLTV